MKDRNHDRDVTNQIIVKTRGVRLAILAAAAAGVMALGAGCAASDSGVAEGVPHGAMYGEINPYNPPIYKNLSVYNYAAPSLVAPGSNREAAAAGRLERAVQSGDTAGGYSRGSGYYDLRRDNAVSAPGVALSGSASGMSEGNTGTGAVGQTNSGWTGSSQGAGQSGSAGVTVSGVNPAYIKPADPAVVTPDLQGDGGRDRILAGDKAINAGVVTPRQPVRVAPAPRDPIDATRQPGIDNARPAGERLNPDNPGSGNTNTRTGPNPGGRENTTSSPGTPSGERAGQPSGQQPSRQPGQQSGQEPGGQTGQQPGGQSGQQPGGQTGQPSGQQPGQREAGVMDVQGVRTSLTSFVDAMFAQGGAGASFGEMLSRDDRRRLGDLQAQPNDDLTRAVSELRETWRSKYNSDIRGTGTSLALADGFRIVSPGDDAAQLAGERQGPADQRRSPNVNNPDDRSNPTGKGSMGNPDTPTRGTDGNAVQQSGGTTPNDPGRTDAGTGGTRGRSGVDADSRLRTESISGDRAVVVIPVAAVCLNPNDPNKADARGKALDAAGRAVEGAGEQANRVGENGNRAGDAMDRAGENMQDRAKQGLTDPHRGKYAQVADRRITLVREDGQWKIDLPEGKSAEAFRGELAQNLRLLNQHKELWPTEQNEAYRMLAAHVLSAAGQ